MNEIHITGIAKHSWTYDGNLYVRLSVPRDVGRPTRSAEAGGNYDYVSVLIPGGASQGLAIERGWQLTVHGWLQSRDFHEGLTEFIERATRRCAETMSVPEELASLSAHRSVNEVVAERWRVGRPVRSDSVENR